MPADFRNLHHWDVTAQEAARIQDSLRGEGRAQVLVNGLREAGARMVRCIGGRAPGS
jgi:hypothetical protein